MTPAPVSTTIAFDGGPTAAGNGGSRAAAATPDTGSGDAVDGQAPSPFAQILSKDEESARTGHGTRAGSGHHDDRDHATGTRHRAPGASGAGSEGAPARLDDAAAAALQPGDTADGGDGTGAIDGGEPGIGPDAPTPRAGSTDPTGLDGAATASDGIGAGDAGATAPVAPSAATGDGGADPALLPSRSTLRPGIASRGDGVPDSPPTPAPAGASTGPVERDAPTVAGGLPVLRTGEPPGVATTGTRTSAASPAGDGALRLVPAGAVTGGTPPAAGATSSDLPGPTDRTGRAADDGDARGADVTLDTAGLTTSITGILTRGSSSSSVMLNLHPPELGQVQARLSVRGDLLQVDLVPEHAAAHDALESALPSLRAHLAQQGVEVDVTLGDPGTAAQGAPAEGGPDPRADRGAGGTTGDGEASHAGTLAAAPTAVGVPAGQSDHHLHLVL